MPIDILEYEVIREVGKGAGSTLHLVRDTKTFEYFVVKNVKIVNEDTKRFIEQLRTEHQVGSQLDHANLRKIHDLHYTRRILRVVEADLVMEWVEGEALRDCASDLSILQIVDVFTQVARGLHAMHEGGYVHADMKPWNIIIPPKGPIKIIDFGQSSPLYTSKDRIQGTIDYIAPEQVARQPLDERTDVFSLGASLHAVLTGEVIQTKLNQTMSTKIMMMPRRKKHQTECPMVKRDVPACLKRLTEDCVRKRPADRPRDMKIVIDRLLLAQTILSRENGKNGQVANASAPAKPNTKANEVPPAPKPTGTDGPAA